MTTADKDLLFVLGGLDNPAAHAFGGPWGQGNVGPTSQPWGGPEPMRGYGYPSYVNPQDVQEEPPEDESFDERILRHTRASRGGGDDVLGGDGGCPMFARHWRGVDVLGYLR